MGSVLCFDQYRSGSDAVRATSLQDRRELSQSFVAIRLLCKKVYQPALISLGSYGANSGKKSTTSMAAICCPSCLIDRMIKRRFFHNDGASRQL